VGFAPGGVGRGLGGVRRPCRVQAEAGDRIAQVVGGIDKPAQRRVDHEGDRLGIRGVAGAAVALTVAEGVPVAGSMA
jgi:hypothetical protein